MIISDVIGGIGNQMFQYAMGKARAAAWGTNLKLDISNYSRYRMHQGFELERVFNCPIAIAEPEEVRRMLGWRANRFAQKLLRRLPEKKWQGNKLVLEPYYHYWPGITDTGPDVYLLGSWQSERYFESIAASLREDFRFRDEAVGQNVNILEEIDACNAVSLHIRRGDYVANGRTNSVHGTCSLDYYRAAIAYIAQRVEKPRFYIFSDDIDWVKSHLVLDFPCRYLSHNAGAESYNDMRLMSACRHHIIANSSFSWWGAWLNESSSKIVVAPEKWFKNANDVRDLFCKGWVVL